MPGLMSGRTWLSISLARSSVRGKLEPQLSQRITGDLVRVTFYGEKCYAKAALTDFYSATRARLFHLFVRPDESCRCRRPSVVAARRVLRNLSTQFCG